MEVSGSLGRSMFRRPCAKAVAVGPKTDSISMTAFATIDPRELAVIRPDPSRSQARPGPRFPHRGDHQCWKADSKMIRARVKALGDLDRRSG
jgi:hypothetical protein